MKQFYLLILVCLTFNYSFADRPTLFCELSGSSKIIHIKSYVLWNVDSNKTSQIPNTWITGSDKTINKTFKLEKNEVNVQLYFPKQMNGRQLSPTTTIHIKIKFKNKEVFYSKHFGRISEDFLGYDTPILCRPDEIYLYLDKNNKLRIKISGKYNPTAKISGSRSNIEQNFSLSYSTRKKRIDDYKLANDVLNDSQEDRLKYSITKKWTNDQFFTNPQSALWGPKNKITNQRRFWDNVSIPFTAHFQNIIFGDYLHVLFKDDQGKVYDFGSGQNDFGQFTSVDKNYQINILNPEYTNQKFKIYWEWKLSKFPCCEGEFKTVEAFQPSIIKLELVEHLNAEANIEKKPKKNLKSKNIFKNKK